MHIAPKSETVLVTGGSGYVAGWMIVGLAVRAAWDFIERDSSGMTLATILPGMILGPVMAESVSGSLGCRRQTITVTPIA
jgi:hypothetical protein